MYRDAKNDYEMATLNRSINQKRGKSRITKKRRKKKTVQKVILKSMYVRQSVGTSVHP